MRSSKPSLAELRPVCQPPDHIARYSGEHWAGRLYGRAVSLRVTWLLVRTGISANAITVIMALVGLAGAALFSRTELWGPVAGAVLIQVYLILDCSDGEVARWRETTGATGIYLDRLGHYVVEAALFVAMGFRAEAIGQPPLGPIAPLVAVDRGGFILLGMAAAIMHLIGKVQTDLVHVARVKAGLEKIPDSAGAAAPRIGLLARARRLARSFPLYRLTGAIEASMVALALGIADALTDGTVFTSAFVIGAFFITALVMVGHLAMILASSRLR